MKHSIPFLLENVDNTSVFKVTKIFQQKAVLATVQTHQDGLCLVVVLHRQGGTINFAYLLKVFL